MTGEKTRGYRAVYETADYHDEVLLPHDFSGVDDRALAARLIDSGLATRRERPLSALELGAGTGRMTGILTAKFTAVTAVDGSADLLRAAAQWNPGVEVWHADIADAVAVLAEQRRTFDLVTAFWSLSYPLGACFEEVTATGITQVADTDAARRAALEICAHVLGAVAPGGMLLAFFFDPETAEQRLVTWAWERLAPTPGGDRGMSRRLLEEVLREAEANGDGILTVTRVGGHAVAPSLDAARRWFLAAHFKDHRRLVGDPDIRAAVDDLIAQRTTADGTARLPSGLYAVQFRRVDAAPA